MKNKRHYKIDPKNHFYDKYYIVNYVKCGVLGNADVTTGEKEEEEEEDNWDDLEEFVDYRTTCLFCDLVFQSPTDPAFLEHLEKDHKFDLESVRSASTESFYDYIKLITYFRHQMLEQVCPVCEVQFDGLVELEQHLAELGHCCVPDRKLWDQPQYLFPLFDDDPLLFEFGDFIDD